MKKKKSQKISPLLAAAALGEIGVKEFVYSETSEGGCMAFQVPVEIDGAEVPLAIAFPMTFDLAVDARKRKITIRTRHLFRGVPIEHPRFPVLSMALFLCQSMHPCVRWVWGPGRDGANEINLEAEVEVTSDGFEKKIAATLDTMKKIVRLHGSQIFDVIQEGEKGFADWKSSLFEARKGGGEGDEENGAPWSEEEEDSVERTTQPEVEGGDHGIFDWLEREPGAEEEDDWFDAYREIFEADDEDGDDDESAA